MGLPKHTKLVPLSDDVIDELVCQALASKRKGTAQEQIRELVRLVELELQTKAAWAQHRERKAEALQPTLGH